MKIDVSNLSEAKKKLFKRSFIFCIIALIVCWFMKLYGFDHFQLDLNNRFFNDLDVFLSKYHLKNIFSLFFLNLELYLMLCCVDKESGKRQFLYVLALLPLTIGLRLLTTYLGGGIGTILEIVYVVCYLSRLRGEKILKSILIVIFNLVYQVISLTTKSLGIKTHEYSYVVFMIFSIDYLILLYLHKEVEVNYMGDGTWFFLGFTAWLYAVAGFVVGLFTLHPIKKAKKWYAIGKEKENVRKAKRAAKKAQKKQGK